RTADPSRNAPLARDDPSSSDGSHSIAAEVLVGEVNEPLAKLFAGGFVANGARNLGVLEDALVHEDGAIGAEGEGQGVAGTGVDGHALAVALHPDERVKGVFAEVVDDDLLHLDVEAKQDVAQKVMRHRAGRLNFFDFEGDGVGFINAHPDGKN